MIDSESRNDLTLSQTHPDEMRRFSRLDHNYVSAGRDELRYCTVAIVNDGCSAPFDERQMVDAVAMEGGHDPERSIDDGRHVTRELANLGIACAQGRT